MSIFRRRYASQGAPPGQLIRPAEIVAPRIKVLNYDAKRLEETTYDSLEALPPFTGDGADDSAPQANGVQWIDVAGLGDGEIVRQLGERFGLHALAVSDVVNVGQRPKFDRYDDSLFIVLRMVTLTPEGELQWEQVSLFLVGSVVLTFQETYVDCLEPLRNRIRSGRKLIRSSGADYLASMVVDAIVDGYFPVLEHYGERLEDLEDLVLAGQAHDALGDLYGTKRDLAGFRRATWPLREALNQLMRDETERIDDTARLHLRDTLDHVMQVVEVNESYRELAASLADVHLSIVGQRTNEIMRVLTVVSAIFIPLTFIAGVYGMNFDTASPFNLPELDWKFGYLFFWMLCALMGGGLLVLFRRLGWLGGRS